ncbi:MAG: hypothetical protein GEU77_02320 [Deltaproteobacteria bacterium]|nr:hypothetical protein [Deltaproteobacteria bacterium]
MVMAKPRISLGLPDHPRCRALIDGKIGVEGYELDICRDFVSAGERHYRFLQGEWDGNYSPHQTNRYQSDHSHSGHATTNR